MILARCPACSTTFRVRPEQLSARHGRVRCGQCQHPFNALENQVEEEALADDLPREPVHALAVSTAPSLFVLQEKTPETTGDPAEPPLAEAAPFPAEPAREEAPVPTPDSTATDEVASPGEPTSPTSQTEAPADSDALEAPAFITFEDEQAPSSAAPPEAPQSVDERIEPIGEIQFEALDQWPEEDVQPAPEASTVDEALADDALDEDEDGSAADAGAPVAPFAFKPDWPDASELDLKSPPDASLIDEGPLDFDSLLHKKVVDDTPGTPLQALEEDLPVASAEAQALASGLPIERPPADASSSEPGDEPEEREAFTEEPEEASGPSALQQVAWAAGATLLVLALLAQGVLVFRSEIAQSSAQMRLFMESVCAGMGCELPLPRESTSITIESSDIQPDASREAFFTLHATLRNRAEFAQAWPHLEITLTDARDKALVRRVLEPKQWLPADMPQDAFPARKEVAARVRFEAPGVAAAGYRVYAFYP